MKLYWAKQIPNHWVAENDNGTLFIVPNIADGWNSRKLYWGHRAALQEVSPEETRLMLQYCGCEEVVA